MQTDSRATLVINVLIRSICEVSLHMLRHIRRCVCAVLTCRKEYAHFLSMVTHTSSPGLMFVRHLYYKQHCEARNFVRRRMPEMPFSAAAILDIAACHLVCDSER